jgi:solute carrier family 38 (sodium-coupled neutral amino acid transporter), member 11
MFSNREAQDDSGFVDDVSASLLGDQVKLYKEELMEEEEAGVDIHERTERLSRLSYGSSFSALHPSNSAYLTTFLLLNTMIGSGILNQPYVFRESGILGALLGFFVTTIATWTGLLCLTAAGVKENIHEYSGLAKKAFDKNGELLVDCAIIVLTFGSQLGYILVVGTLLSDLLGSWGCDSVVCNDMFATMISVGVFVTPVCMYRHFGHLAILSLFSIAAIVAVLLLVFIAGPIKHKYDHTSSNYKTFDLLGTISSTGSIVFSMECCSANFQAFVSTEKKSRNMKTWRVVTGTAVIAGAIMCSMMGLVGYLSFGNDTEGEILDNFAQHGYDVFKVMVVVHLILYIPVNFVIMRYSIVKVFFKTRSELLPMPMHTFITIFLMVLTTAIVLLLLGMGLESGVAFSLLLNITGGIGGKCTCCFI